VNAVRVTGGSLKGRPVLVPEREAVRYTSSKVRESLFQLVGLAEGSAFLDLFAGSGAVSIEALSRGASSATLVEKDRTMCTLIRENMSRMGLLKKSTILNMDVLEAIAALHRKGCIYDIIFMDPPYERGHVLKTLETLSSSPVSHDDTMLVMEHSKRESVDPPEGAGFVRTLSRRYGDTVITILKLQQSSSIGRTEWKHE
jgi:16S rRNA (guanine966-N2)-methyltransferase